MPFGNGNRSASGMTPRRRLIIDRIASSSDSTYSVLPPPMSNVSTGPDSGPSPCRTPRTVSRASSSPLTTSTSRPVVIPSASANERPLDAWRTALVATMRTSPAPKPRARATYAFTTARVRAIGVSPRTPEGRRGIGRRGLLPLERPDIVHDLPALVFGQVLPRGHRASSVGYLPEELAVSLLLDGFAGPVRGLRRWQRRRGRPITLPRGAVARHTVCLDGLLRVADALYRILRRLRVGRRDP